MPRSKSAVSLSLLLCLLPVLAIAGDEMLARQWLEKMYRASHLLNYVGKFVYQHDRQLGLMSIVHAVDESGERERLVSLDDTGREVIRHKDRVTCILPDSKSVMVEKGRPTMQFPPEFPVNIELLTGHYTFIVDKQEKVAGQRAQRIVIQPVDNFRYGHRLWVDVETGLLLKTQLLDENNKLLEQFMFTEIEFMDKVPEELLQPQATGPEYTWYETETVDDEPNDDSPNNWEVKSLPSGFGQDSARSHHKADKVPVEHLIFSDGLASVSVFIEAREDKSPAIMGLSRMGAINAYGRMLENYYVTAVGEVPGITVRMIGESVTYKHTND